MKAFACLLLVCYVAGQTAALDLKNRTSALENLFNKTVSTIGSEAKKAEAIVTDFFKKIADTQNICTKDGKQINCCAKDLLKNQLCLGLVTDCADLSVNVLFSINNKTFINETLSGKNPPPVCAPLPHLPVIKLCIEPHDIRISNDTITVCLDFSARVLSKDLARVSMNCFKVGTNGDVSFVKASNATSKAIVNIDTGKVNPMLNKTVNPKEIGKEAIAKLGRLFG